MLVRFIMPKFKMLLLNLGYCTGLNGSLFQYLSNFYRYIFLPSKIEENVLHNLSQLIHEEHPDLICLIEIEQGKQISGVINKEYSFYDIETKYGKDSFLRKLPFFKNKSNAFLSRHKISFKKHFLKNGTKKLLYELSLPENIKLIFMHFSLSRKVREKQFDELDLLFKNVKNKIICGDFNIFGGFSEIDRLIKKSKLRLAQKEPTFPAFNPKRPLDLFLCSKNLKIKTRVLNKQLSDHLPVLMELETSKLSKLC